MRSGSARVLGRQVGRAIERDRRHEPQRLLGHKALHIHCQHGSEHTTSRRQHRTWGADCSVTARERRHNAGMRKPVKLLAIPACLVLVVAGGLLPFVGWLLLVLALHILVSEFETRRDWIKSARRPWPRPSPRLPQAR